jgi:ABC-type transporter Mla subunit MlaD
MNYSFRRPLLMICAVLPVLASLQVSAPAQPAPQWPPPTKAAPSSPPPSAAAPPPAQEGARALFDIWAKQAAPLKKNLDDAAKRLGDANTGIQQAEQTVDDLLKGANDAINAASDNSPFMTELRKSIQRAADVAARSAAAGDTRVADIASRQQEALKGYEKDMGQLYGAAQQMMRELLARKDSLVRLKELEQLELAVEVAKQAVEDYRKFVNSGLELLQSLSRQPGRPGM